MSSHSPNPTLEQLAGAQPKKLPLQLRMRSPIGKTDHYVERDTWHVVDAQGNVLAGGKMKQVGYRSDVPVFRTRADAQEWIEHKTRRAQKLAASS